ncbi:E3 ubiquitin-protein ligase CBL-like isoform X2 [Pristis pectinata]|uniref:E3 ubiquitin-protein ligase CBL-like isoform X2 n=1 Tax=Pristis pectinata TaxID=685728 RepID=UPI00223D1053|nr:E3 ubiquitin-protein ligase CBL-like isoform X2 [Pristis pectinata]
MSAGWRLPAEPEWVRAERRKVRKVQGQLRRLVRNCDHPRLRLRNSPPYLPEIGAAAAAHLERLLAGSRHRERERGRRHLNCCLLNLAAKCKQTSALFSDAGEQMFQEGSQARRNLTKLSLILSHILSELRAIFPEGQYQGDTYTVTKADAAEFWRKSFGNESIVPWADFRDHLYRVHPFGSGMESMALRSTIDLTCNDHISVFEFDIFTRLFQPWPSLLRNWNSLAVTHPGYMAFLTYDEVKSRLQGFTHKPGSYIFRLSCTQLGQWAIGYVTEDGSILQTIPHNKPLSQALTEGAHEGFYLYPDGRDFNPDLTALCETSQQDHIQVSQEQYQLYCEMGSSFQMCKICTENNKNMKMEPCGHLICDSCLSAWLHSDGHTCPFCRCEIRGTQPVVVEPFAPRELRPHHAAPALEADAESEDEEEEDNFEDIGLLVDQLASLHQEDVDHPLTPADRPPVPPRTDLLGSRGDGRVSRTACPRFGVTPSVPPVPKPSAPMLPPEAEQPISGLLLDWMRRRPLPSVPDAGGGGRAPTPVRPSNQRRQEPELTAMDLILSRRGAERRPLGGEPLPDIDVDPKYTEPQPHLSTADGHLELGSGAHLGVTRLGPPLLDWSSEDDDEDEEDMLEPSMVWPPLHARPPASSPPFRGQGRTKERAPSLPQSPGPPLGDSTEPTPIDPVARATLLREGFPILETNKALTISHNDLPLARSILQGFLPSSGPQSS